MSGYQHKMYLENRCFMNFFPCPFISLFLTLCLSICLSVCVCVSLSLFLLLYLALSLSLSPTPLSILFFLFIYISFSNSPSLRVNISVFLSLPVFSRLSPFLSSSLLLSLNLPPPSLSFSQSPSHLAPLSIPLFFSPSPCPSLSFPLSFSLSLCPSPSLSLSPSLSHPAPSLSPFPPPLFISVLLLVSLSPGRYLIIRRPGYTSGTAFIVQRLRVLAARVITTPDKKGFMLDRKKRHK